MRAWRKVTQVRLARQSYHSVSLFTAALFVVACFTAPPAMAAKSSQTGSQLAFGIEMAKRGLWNEALFRFSRVLKERPGDVRVLNNMAVAYEAIGEFDLALDHYKRALEGDSANRDLRRNYAQFVEFYESLRLKTDEESKATGSTAESAASEPDANGDSSR
jgi:Tfp pilus assembly protein PilF